jgi:hypothetical protein
LAVAHGGTPDDDDGGAPPPATPRRTGLFPRVRHLPRLVWLLGFASLLNDVSSEAIFPLLPLFLTSLGAPMSYI